MTTKAARRFFLWMLCLFVIVMAYLLTPMADAFNLSPYTFKLRSRTTAGDSLYIVNDTLYVNQMAVSLHNLIKAVAVLTDTVRGAGTVVGIVNDTLIIDTDSTGNLVTIVFGGKTDGGGLRWNKTANTMQYTNNFSTWTDIGSGGGTADSNAVIYSTDRVATYADTGLYLGDVGDSTMLWYNITDDNIISFVKVFYNEDVDDSALVTWGSMMAEVGATGSGDISGVVVDYPLQGGASSGDVSISLDNTAIAVSPLASGGGAELYIYSTGVTIPNILEASGFLSLSSTRAWSILYTDALSTVDTIPIGANGTVLTSNGATAIPTFQALTGGGDVTGVTAGSGLTGTSESGPNPTLNIVGGWSIGVATDSVYVKQVSGDSITAGTVADARIATTIARDTEIRDSIHTARTMASIWTLSANWVNTANPWADNEVANNLTIDDAGVASTISRDSEIRDSIHTARTMASIWTLSADWVNTANPWADNEVANNLTVDDAGIASTIARDAEIRDSIHTARTMASIWTLSADWVNTANPWADNEVANNLTVDDNGIASTITRDTEAQGLIRDSLFNNSNNFFKTAGNGLTSSTSTVNVVVGTNNGLSINGDSLYIDTTKILRSDEFRGNWLIAWPDSALKIGSGNGLSIGSSITLGSDITDDSLVQEFWPEYAGMTLFRGFSTTDIAYNDSIVIRGDADSANGNFLLFNDSTLTSGNHRRHVSIAIPVPDRVDSLRRVTVKVMSKDSTTGSVEFFMRAALFTRPPAYSLVDSAVGGSVLDRDSSCAAILRTLHLNPASGNWAVTPFTTRYLLLSGRRDAGNAWNWGKAYKITAVWSRTKL